MHKAKSMSSDFVAGVVYSAAQIIMAHGCTRAAEDLLIGTVRPTDNLRGCAEHDLKILREHIPAWRDVPRGI